MTDNRIETLLENIEKDKSIECVFINLGKNDKYEDVIRGSSGLLSLDIALGGGYPYGRIIELFGPNSGGKSTITLHAIVAAHKRGNVACLVDAEYSFSMEYAKNVGVDPEQILVTQPDYGEQGLEAIIQLAGKMKAGDVIVVDSVAALVPKAEIESPVEKDHVGLQARMMSKALRSLTGEISKSGVLMLFVNQTRQKIGVAYGDPTDTPGGKALKFYASQRLNVKNIGRLKKGEESIGHKLQIEVVKNKVSPPFRKAITKLIYGRGVPRAYDVLSMAEAYKIVQKGGAWYSYNESRIGQGFDNSAEFLEANQNVLEAIERDVLTHLGYRPE